ncbi:RibD family protein [Streptomyces sp. NPDC051956]|uniref:RibD family protein n=1 Tax=Streptomyces sp. NPDC051956 TaxID=3365677 RepID=UPI0037D3136D
MANRPRVLLSVAVSLDGFTDDAVERSPLLTDASDHARADRLRADADAIVVTGDVLFKDDPQLRVDCPGLRAERIATGRPEHPLKVVFATGPHLEPGLTFWRTGDARAVYASDADSTALAAMLDGRAEVTATGPEPDLAAMLDHLGLQGVRSVLVEGGALAGRLLAENLVDELRVCVVPLLLGGTGAARFLDTADLTVAPGKRLALIDSAPVGDAVVLRYAPKAATQ